MNKEGGGGRRHETGLRIEEGGRRGFVNSVNTRGAILSSVEQWRENSDKGS